MTTSDLDVDPYAEFDPMAQFRSTVAGDVRTPYPTLVAKRRDTPIERRRQVLYEGIEHDAYYVYRYDDVARVMRDNVTFSSSSIGEMMGIVVDSDVIVGLDEPEHRRHRSRGDPAFRPKPPAPWEDTLISEA